MENKEKLDNLEDIIANLQKQLEDRENLYQEIKDKHVNEIKDLEKILADLSNTKQEKKIATKEAEEKVIFTYSNNVRIQPIRIFSSQKDEIYRQYLLIAAASNG